VGIQQEVYLLSGIIRKAGEGDPEEVEPEESSAGLEGEP